MTQRPVRPAQTLGETRVRLSFNPGDLTNVDEFKAAVANWIDLLEDESRSRASTEGRRCFKIAQEHLEAAAMWAVNGYTLAGYEKSTLEPKA